MRLRIWVLISCLFLSACAGDPKPSVPPLRAAAEGSHRAALIAANALRWDNAEESWNEALVAYQAMDDWKGQGQAKLGLAQAESRLGKTEKANLVLAGMFEQELFPKDLRAQARYQQALLALPAHPSRAQLWLDEAINLCGKECALNVQFDNLAARLAAVRADWAMVKLYAERALAAAAEKPAERSHARRLLAQALLAQGNPAQARAMIELALADDKNLAEPEWIIEDYQLLLLTAQALKDDALMMQTRARIGSLCQAKRAPICRMP